MKKLLCLFCIFLLFIGTAFASDEKDKFLNYIQKSHADFKVQQEQYYKKTAGKTEKDKEEAFKKLYNCYIEYYRDITTYHNGNVATPFDRKYVDRHKDEYLKYGFGFIIPEGDWCIEEDYTMLINTKGIPKTWSEWLTLQEKYITKNREICVKRGSCEGGTMTIPEREQAIVDLSKTEQKSKVIASIKSQDYDFIPYTSNELAFTYLLGNDLMPIYDGNNKKGVIKLHKDSKKSFEHFIKNHKDSAYWNLVNEYYKKLKHNKFIYSEDTAVWVVNELNKMN